VRMVRICNVSFFYFFFLALDLCDPTQELLMHEVSDELVKLVAKYGGLLWGGDGKGFCSG
uniref:hypothetical protein n=1 Tax=Vibrio vulnificus TaxID=672 RepID=UPI00057F3D3B